jgi:acyl-CoA thioesterase-1
MHKAVYIMAIFSLLPLGLLSCDAGSTGGGENGDEDSELENKIVCFGDSLTAGMSATIVGVDDPENSYPAYLEALLTVPVVNTGVSGDTTLGSISRVKSDVLGHNPKMVIIELGANDLFNIFPPAQTQANLLKLIKQIEKPGRKIYLAKFYTYDVAHDILTTMGVLPVQMRNAIINQYETMYKAILSETNVELVSDIWTGVWGINMADEIHPTAAGYKIMMNNYFKVIQPYLQSQNWLK